MQRVQRVRVVGSKRTETEDMEGGRGPSVPSLLQLAARNLHAYDARPKMNALIVGYAEHSTQRWGGGARRQAYS